MEIVCVGPFIMAKIVIYFVRRIPVPTEHVIVKERVCVNWDGVGAIVISDYFYIRMEIMWLTVEMGSMEIY